ncbi:MULTISPECIES: non-ribosomal peptide synthetase [Stenotrophomonas]|uniref:Amino acid adenylation domain-containing protein n=1 Tax=Stenotrophomonas maltophilia TaxID=40324 RepID=A0A431ULX8_STEMA|nr:non-ribosomal peptide synthetase [Stenotrophomonas maltophilia]RTQ90552.1 amino acid adenylation domain-containing protein [Stenotrophomonas maltophilia]
MSIETGSEAEQLKRAVLLRELQKRHARRQVVAVPAVIPRRSGPPPPLSWAQQRLWFLDQLDPAAGAAYHIASATRLQGVLDHTALQAALDRIVARHESLRTHFESVDGQPRQIIAAGGVGFPLDHHDLSGMAVEEQELAVLAMGSAEAQRRFNLAQGPLVRGQLLRLSEDGHVLLITQHHIVSDGWSLGILMQELGTLYAAFSEGREDPLPPLTLQYADYAVWQRGWLRDGALQRQLDHWQTHLAGAPVAIDLPTDRPRPAVQRYRGNSLPLRIGTTLLTALKHLSREHGTTLFMTLLSAWSIVLSRFGGQTDLVIGTPIANRQRPQLAGLIGFFVNTLALRVRLDGDPTVAELLAQIRSTALAAYAHQDVPFEQVVDAVKPVRSLAHNPLFQVMLSLDNTPDGSNFSLPGLALSSLPMPQVTTQFELSLSLVERAGELYGGLDYACDLFEPASVQAMAEAFEHVLASMVTNDQQRVSTLPLLSAVDQQALVRVPDAPTRYVQNAPIQAAFEAHAASTPDAVALVHGKQTLSYRELDVRANQLAHALRARGAGPEQRVALCMDRGLDLVVGVLGILKSGAAYVPMDPSAPRERLAFMLADSAPMALVTDSVVAEQLPSFSQVPLLLLDELDVLRGQPVDKPSMAGFHPQHLAYVIYTSGSTGQPKGVMVEHGHVTRLFEATRDAFQFGPDEVWTLFHSIAFDFSVWELWGALLYGGRLVVVPTDISRSPGEFHALLVEQGVTVLNQTPSAFRQLIAAEAGSTLRHRLRHVIFGGEALDLSMLAPWILRNDPDRTRLVNMYGITEITVHATFRRIERADVEAGRGSLIGTPLRDLRILVLDAHQQPVPVGVCGELYVGGAGVARGYLNRPELTDERFLPDPYDSDPSARLYRTGDLGRRLPDGDLQYLGRNDFQVKIRGFRIELGEIEACLQACDGVREAVVHAREDTPGDKRLVGYLIAEAGGNPSAAALREALRHHLAEYMIPTAFVRVEEWPLTGNGKLDRHALPAPDATAIATHRYQAPVNEVEQVIASIWQDVLGIERVGRHDNFFELGGDSIRTIAVVAKAKKLGLSLSVAQVFRSASVAQLAKVTVSQRPISAVDTTTDAVLAGDPSLEARYPMTMLQKGMLFDAQAQSDRGVYHDVFSLELQLPRWDEPLMRETLQVMARRHPVLRTAFVFDSEGEPMQTVWKKANVPLQVMDLSGFDRIEQDVQIQNFLEAEKRNDFDESQAPLLRIFVHLRGGSLQYTLSFHHAILDGWSVSLLQAELFGGYLARLGAPGPGLLLAPLNTHPGHAAAAEKQALTSETQRAFWRKHLGGYTPCPMPTGMGTEWDDVADFSGTLKDMVPVDQLRGLQGLADRLCVPVRTVLLCAHMSVLSLICNTDDVITGLVCNVRPEAEDGDKVLGLFLNTLPLRVTRTHSSWEQAILQTFERELDVIEHRFHPYFALYAENGRVAHFESTFNYVHFHAYDQLAGTSGVTILGNHSHEATGYPLSATFSQSQDQIAFQLKVDPQRIGARHAARILGYYKAALSGMLADPAAPALSASLISADEREAVVHTFNDTSRPRAASALIHQQFEQQVLLQPNADAVEEGGTVLSYSELNRRANQVAHVLAAFGIGPDDRVALGAERSISTMVGLLGILKAGAAYVPVDPAMPPERIRHILDDSGALALVSTCAQAPCLQAVAGELPVLGIDGPQVTHALDTPISVAGLSDRHLAYVIYTSGSTGLPKGVMVEHHSVINLWMALQESIFAPYPPGARIGLNASVAFDASLKSITQLMSGHCVIMVPEEVRFSGEGMLDFLRTARLDVLDGTPVQLAMWFQAGLSTAQLCASMTFIIGGDAVSAELWTAMRALPGTRFFNVYGPTECTVDATIADVRAGAPRPHIGKPVANGTIQILDAHGAPCPIGVYGELFVGGTPVSRGYLHRPALSAEHFLPDPNSPHTGARRYRTGDLARWLPDGTIEYKGRNDFQIKIRGFRVELGEIESRLRTMPGVRDAVVVAHEDAGEGRQLCAYVLGHNEAIGSPAHMRDALLMNLSDYMVPALYVILPQWPLNANGKLDRARLPRPDDSAVARRSYTAPLTDMERMLAAIWCEVLLLERVGVHDPFFALGGDSIRAVQVVQAVRRRGIALTVVQLLRHPTIAALATCMSPPASPPKPVSAVAALPRGRYRLSSMQQVMVMGYRESRDEGVYHCQQSFHVQDEDPDPDAMARALQALIAAHPAMRTRFSQDGEGIWQTVLDHMPFILERDDLSHLDAAAQEVAVLRVLREDRVNRFDALGGQALYRFRWFTRSSNSYEFMISIHHAICDGWGNIVFLGQLLQAYEACRRGASFALTAQANVAGELVALEQDTEAQGRARRYWNAVERTPTLRARRGDPGGGSLEPIALPMDNLLGEQVRAYCRENAVPLKALFVTAYHHLMRAMTGQKRTTVGVVMNGRSEKLSDPLGAVGLFWNMAPVAADEGDDCGRLASRLQEVEQHARADLRVMVPEADTLFFGSFNFVDFHHSRQLEAQPRGVNIKRIHAFDRFHYPLNLTMAMSQADASGLLTLNWSAAYFDRSEIEALGAQYLSIVRDIVRIDGTAAGSVQ